MSDEHKSALATGREQARAVRAYLDALDQNKPKRGRKRTRETVADQLAAMEEKVASTGGVSRLDALQRRRDLQAELASMDSESTVDIEGLKQAFVRHGREYAERKGIEYQSFREYGVPPAVLSEAGFRRGRARS